MKKFFPPETWPRGQQKGKIATNINACCYYSNPPGGAVIKPPNSCRPITVFQQFEQEAGWIIPISSKTRKR